MEVRKGYEGKNGTEKYRKEWLFIIQQRPACGATLKSR